MTLTARPSAGQDEHRPGLSGGSLQALALTLIGATLMAGHVQAGLVRFGPLVLLPLATFGAAILTFVLASPGRLHATRGLLVCGVLLLVTLPSILQTASTEYGISKLTGLLQLTILFTIMAALLVDRLADVEVFWNGVVGMGLLGVAVSALDLASGVDLGARGSINEAFLNPISISRVGGVAALWFGLGGFPGVSKPWRYGTVAVGLAVLVGGASRGPMLALIVAGMVAAVHSRVLRGRLAVAILAAAIAVSAGLGQSMIEDATERVVEADRATSTADAEGSSRIVLWAEATTAILDKPYGWGLGQFGFDGDVEGSGEYPHNIILEIGLEVGLLGLLVACFAWWRVVRYLWNHPDEARAGRQLALIVFWSVSALFSSDFNGNRVLIAAVVALSVTALTEQSQTDLELERA